MVGMHRVSFNGPKIYEYIILGAFAELQEVTISFISFRLSAWNNSHLMDFDEN
jgi:hypothetical protein